MKFKNAVLGAVIAAAALPAIAQDEMTEADTTFARTLYFLSPSLMQTAAEILSDEQSLPTQANIKRVLSSPAYADRIKQIMKAQECPERKPNAPKDLDAS